MQTRAIVPLILALVAALAPPARAATLSCLRGSKPDGGAAEVMTAIARLRPLLTKDQLATFERAFDYANATHWSNLPIGLVPRTTLRIGDHDAKQAATTHHKNTATKTDRSHKHNDEVRHADDFLVPFDKRPIGWGGGNY